MAKVTSKLQVTVPKTVAEHYRIRPGDEIQWVIAGDTIRVVPLRRKAAAMTTSERLRRFDLATTRQQKRNATGPARGGRTRGWAREELYRRGGAR
jgi:bifunctional DNA-binding transcriptional regulator/antitoxin component of YhaV-PrlF toxin-antitoxin module